MIIGSLCLSASFQQRDGHGKAKWVVKVITIITSSIIIIITSSNIIITSSNIIIININDALKKTLIPPRTLSTASGAPVVGNPFGEGFGKLIQGSLESSNVNVVQELVDMIETQRAYEVSSKSITAVDEMKRYISNNL